MKRIHGFLTFNKPVGWTTYDCIRDVRKKLKVRKAGHAGNLDPHATGVVVIGLGKATRLLSYVMELEKEYIANIQLGILTDTWDVTGEILLRKEVPEFTKEDVQEVVMGFTGEIYQIPPPFSAVRRNGKRLYEFARDGVLLSGKPKKVKIHRINVLKVTKESISLQVISSKGTYIRSLAKEMAEKLGTVGVVDGLSRERVGHFSIKEATSPDKLTEDKVLSIDYGVIHLPEIIVKEQASYYFQKGMNISVQGFARFSSGLSKFTLVRVYDEDKRFIGIGQLIQSGLAPRKVLIMKE